MHFFLGNEEDPCYLSPELLEYLKRRDHHPLYDIEKSEVFSLGVTIFKAITFIDTTIIYDLDNFNINSNEISN